MLGMFPFANTAFAKLMGQVLKLSSEQSSIQSFDSKDLERCLRTKKRMFIGSTIVSDPKRPKPWRNNLSELFEKISLSAA